MTYVHVVHGWVWKWGQQVGGNANWPCLGGSSIGDDPEYSGHLRRSNSHWGFATLSFITFLLWSGSKTQHCIGWSCADIGPVNRPKWPFGLGRPLP